MPNKEHKLSKRHFTQALFSFLQELAENNDRTWWEKNKDRYVETVREPALDFITDFAPRLNAISPHFLADARTVGGSLMRPYRDTRFSKDKTPYKTNVGIQFRHERGKDVHAPGFYLHLEPGGSFAGVGMWRPDPATAARVRKRISDHAKDWTAASTGSGFTKVWTIERDENEMLKRIPKELDGDQPRRDDLRLKSFIAGSRLTQRDITTAGFDERLAAMFAESKRFVRFLCDAIDTPF